MRDRLEPHGKRSITLARGLGFQALLSAVVILIPAAFLFGFFGGWLLSIPFLFFAILSLGGALFFTPTRLLEVDDLGVRLSRGGRVVKNIPIWDLSRVRLSAKRAQTVYNIFVFDYLLLFVQGSNRRQIIKADSLSYEVGMDEFRDFSEYVVDLARRNGKEFENSRFLDVRRGKLTTRLVGDRFPISALLLTALYLVFVSLAIIGMAIEGLKPVFLFAILLFGALAVGSAYYLLSTQRMFCKVCKGHRYFLRRKTQMTCMVCKQPFEEEFRSPIKES